MQEATAYAVADDRSVIGVVLRRVRHRVVNDLYAACEILGVGRSVGAD